ncbi:hypothetical protein CLIB1444_02S08790 [[Candida] jaroonii]|uniref:Uncharacterized protein n=1 Tax=[Candida] jaroonii TaxID=467808 RepID=A0ACA9Y3C4_9ASCO|nr:hypothetical protein CLIB1444_02S08790 [[Candida] jaroonii]
MNNEDNLRNQFMSNTNASRDTIKYDRIPYPTNELDDFEFNDHRDQPRQKETYEMNSLNYTQEFPGNQHDSPVLNQPPQIPPKNNAHDKENLPLPPNPFDTPFDETYRGNDFYPTKPQPPIPEFDEEALMKRNEKHRIRQLKSKPRFHYTRLPYFGILVTAIQVIVFIVELIKMSTLTGSAFQTQPYFNPMLGPSTYLLVNMGARYTPCMNQIEGITNDTSIQYPCANSTKLDTNVCSLNELCGLSGIPTHGDSWDPNQWYRIITPIFLHAGFLHILFNLLLQVTMGFSIERYIGTLKYAIIYMLSGVSGFLLGANFTPNGIASTGCSGSLFGIVATNLLLFVYSGRKNTNMYGTKKFGLFLAVLIGEVIVSFVLGLLPGLDNFSHLGGFAMGFLASFVLLKDPYWIYESGIITYQSKLSTFEVFKNNWNPLYNIDDKIRSRFYMWLGVRGLCFIIIVLYFALLINNFFGKGEITTDNGCSWCKYISCLPVNGWCDNGYVSVTTQKNDSPTKSSPSSSSLITTTEVFTSTIPSSIENTDFKRDFQLEESVWDPLDDATIGRNDATFGNIGVSLIMGLILYRYFKFRR